MFFDDTHIHKSVFAWLDAFSGRANRRGPRAKTESFVDTRGRKEKPLKRRANDACYSSGHDFTWSRELRRFAER